MKNKLVVLGSLLCVAVSFLGCDLNSKTVSSDKSQVENTSTTSSVSKENVPNGVMQEVAVKKMLSYNVRTLFNKTMGYYVDVPVGYGSLQVMGGGYSSNIYDDSEFIGPLLPNGTLLSDDEKRKFFVYLNEQQDSLFKGMKVDKTSVSSDGKVVQYDAYTNSGYYFSCRVFDYGKGYSFCFNKDNDVATSIVDSVRRTK